MQLQLQKQVLGMYGAQAIACQPPMKDKFLSSHLHVEAPKLRS